MIERLSAATQSQSLGWSNIATRDVDYIAALGMIAQHNELQSAVVRLMGGDNQSASTVQQAMWRKLGRKRTLTAFDRHDIAMAVAYWLNPACQNCTGGKIAIPDTGRLSEADCGVCSGSGRRPHACSGESYAATLKALDDAAGSAGYAVAQKVA